SANAFFHLGGEPPQMKVARHGFDPGIGHTDQRLAQVGISKSDGFEHGARRSAVAPVSDSVATMLEVHGERLQQRERFVDKDSGGPLSGRPGKTGNPPSVT